VNFTGLLSLAWEGILRKKGRNALTMLGIVIAILSLSLVISAGEGMDTFLETELKQEDNMRQVAVNPGFGKDIGNFLEDVEVLGQMSEAKRRRIKRAILNRRRPHPRSGRKTRILDEKTLAAFRDLPHVTEVKPIIIERYDVQYEDNSSSAVMSYAVSAKNERYNKRLIAGSFFSSDEAHEVVVHEYLLYGWKVYSDEEQARWVGREIEITPRTGESGLLDMLRMAGGPNMSVDFSSLLGGMEVTPEEQKVLLRLASKTMQRRAVARAEKRDTVTLRIVGIIRDYEQPDGAFNILEDGNSFTADIFLPRGFARKLFLQSAFNVSQGYTRAIVIADTSSNAEGIRKAVQKQGFIAISVGAILDQVNTVIKGLTIFQSFITGIVLIVAGLGIMTTMITSVVERTREIGIWKAVGATNRQVMTIFLMESAMVGAVGSLLGLGLARVLMFPGNMLGRSIIEQQTSMPFGGDVLILPMWVVIAAPLFATLIAVVAALYPAFRGARIDPVRALRHD
jgi:putative ABC transport system permease protein